MKLSPPNTARPRVDRIVCSSESVGWRRWASTEMPRKAVPRMTPIQVRVRPALRLSGALKALTPLEMASTPVRATAPDENARSRANRVTPLTSAPLSVKWSSCSWSTGRGGRSPV